MVEILFTSQVLGRSVVVTLGGMKAELAAIQVSRVAAGGAALRVHQYLREDALLLLDIHGVPFVFPTTKVSIKDAQSDPIRAAISLPYFVSDPVLQKVMLARWVKLSCQRSASAQAGYVLKDWAELKDPRHKNDVVQKYCSALAMVSQVKAACLQFNIDQLAGDEEGSKLSANDSISLALAERLALVPLGFTEQMPANLSVTFVYLDNDDTGERLHQLREQWKTTLAKAREPAAASKRKKQRTSAAAAGSSAAASTASGSSRKRKGTAEEEEERRSTRPRTQ